MALLLALVALPIAPASHAVAAEVDAKAAAREHFQKGVSAYADQRFAEAAEEFETAYRLSPAFKLLYNIGQVNVALGRSVEAVEAFDKYLKQGAAVIPPERKREVSAEIEKQLGRIGTISVRTFPDEADVRLDGVLVGRTPLSKPLRVNAGRHTIEALAAAHKPATREVEVVGKAEIAIELTLEAIVAPSPPPVAASPAPAKVEPAPPPPVVQPLVERVIIQSPPAAAPNETRASGPAQATRRADSGPPFNWQRAGGVVVMVAGLATATVGGVKVYRGLNQSNDARERLNSLAADPANLNDAEWNAANADFAAGKSRNREGWTIAGIGGAILIGGLVLIVTAPERSNTVQVASWVTTDSGGVMMKGAW
jgi:tetratricopeptide (TPR) repeat protein